MAKSKKTEQETVELTETELEEAKGGIGLLLPAVQKVRDAAAASTTQKVASAATKTYKV